MATVQVRKFPDDVYARIVEAAEASSRSLEGQIRHTLINAYPEPRVKNETQREKWQALTAQRIQTVFDRLREDKTLKRTDPVSLSLALRCNPEYLFNCLDGLSGPTAEFAEKMQLTFSCNKDWVLGIPHTVPFNYDELGSSAYLSPSHLDDIYFLCVQGKYKSVGELIVVINKGDAWEIYHESTHFNLKPGKDGMSSNCRSNLKKFLISIKTSFQGMRIQSRIYSGEVKRGHYHPKHYINQSVDSDWMERLLSGQQPKEFTLDFDYELKDIEKYVEEDIEEHVKGIDDFYF